MTVNILVLTELANVMKKKGMCKGIRRDDGGRVCLMGGFDAVAIKRGDSEYSGDSVYIAEIAALADTIAKSKRYAPRLDVEDQANYCVPGRTGPSANRVCGFNNHPDTNLKDVLEMIHRTKQRVKRGTIKS